MYADGKEVRYVHLLVPDAPAGTLATIQALLRDPTLTRRHRERLDLLKGALLGWDLPALCTWSGRSPRTVQRVLDRFAGGGLDALPDAPRSGRSAKTDAAYRAALNAAMEQPPRELGLAVDGWTSARLSAYLARETGVTVSPGWLRTILHEEGWRGGRPKHAVHHLQDPEEVASCLVQLAEVGKKATAHPAQYEVYFGDETHVDTNPCLYQLWHKQGTQIIIPAAGWCRRLSLIGSITTTGHDGLAVLTDRADSAAFGRSLAALDIRHQTTGHQIILVLDNGSCHTSKVTRAAIADRAAWLEVRYLSRYSPELNPIKRAWNRLKREHRAYLAASLPDFVTEMLAGTRTLGGQHCDVVNEVPQWWLDGHKRQPTGRKAGRPLGAKDSYPRQSRRQNLPAPT